ncbi:hypothetical protein LINGRAHAP2_LOCUS16714 [Linum grandiflorum]
MLPTHPATKKKKNQRQRRRRTVKKFISEITVMEVSSSSCSGAAGSSWEEQVQKSSPSRRPWTNAIVALGEHRFRSVIGIALMDRACLVVRILGILEVRARFWKFQNTGYTGSSGEILTALAREDFDLAAAPAIEVRDKCIGRKNNRSLSWGFTSVIGRRREMEDAVAIVPGFISRTCTNVGGCTALLRDPPARSLPCTSSAFTMAMAVLR